MRLKIDFLRNLLADCNMSVDELCKSLRISKSRLLGLLIGDAEKDMITLHLLAAMANTFVSDITE